MNDPPPPKPFQITILQALYWMSAACVVFALYGAGGVEAIPVCMMIAGVALGCYALWVLESWVTAVFALTLVVVSMVYGAIVERGNTESARRASCQNALKSIALAVHNSHDTHRRIPARTIRDPSGTSLLSWRVSILPFLEEAVLFARFNQSESWDGPTNLPLASHFPQGSSLYRCPADRIAPATETNYVAIGDENSCWPDDAKITFANIPDGLSNTLMVVETHESGITWTEPCDLDITAVAKPIGSVPGKTLSSDHGGLAVQYLDGSKIRKSHGKMAMVLFADGSVRALSSNVDPEVLKQLVNRHDGKPAEVP